MEIIDDDKEEEQAFYIEWGCKGSPDVVGMECGAYAGGYEYLRDICEEAEEPADDQGKVDDSSAEG